MPHPVEIKNVSKMFGNTKALRGVDLEVKQGEITALIGASGSGKSTLLRQISGLMSCGKNGGTIEVLGWPVQRHGKMEPNIRVVRISFGANAIAVIKNLAQGR